MAETLDSGARRRRLARLDARRSCRSRRSASSLAMFDEVGLPALRERSVALTGVPRDGHRGAACPTPRSSPRATRPHAGAQLSIRLPDAPARLAAIDTARRRRGLPRTGHRPAGTGPAVRLVPRRLARGRRPRRQRSDAHPSPAPHGAPHDHDRLRRDARAVPPDRPARLVRPGRGGRVRGRASWSREHFHPWTPAAGPERVRLGVHGRPRPADVAALRDGRHVPGLPLPPGGHRPRRGDARRDVPGPVLPRAGRRRGPQRARHRRRSGRRCRSAAR